MIDCLTASPLCWPVWYASHMPKQRRVAVVGPRNTGKTRLLFRVLNLRFCEIFHGLTIEMAYDFRHGIGAEAVYLMDTGGCNQEQMSPGWAVVRQQTIAAADSFIVVLDCSNLESARECDVVMDEIARLRHSVATASPVVLVINKMDLCAADAADLSIAHEFAAKHADLVRVVYFVSAVNSSYEQVMAVFDEAIRAIPRVPKLSLQRPLSASAPGPTRTLRRRSLVLHNSWGGTLRTHLSQRNISAAAVES